MATGGEDKVKDSVTVVAPNGAELEEGFHPNQKVKITLADAVKEFSKTGVLDENSQYVLVLGETALNPELSLSDAGVTAGAKLKIRSKRTPVDG